MDKAWKYNNLLKRLNEGHTYDFGGFTTRDDKDYEETWWFKKPYRCQIDIGAGDGLDDVLLDPTRWHKSLAKLKKIFKIEGDSLIIPAGTQIDFADIVSNSEAWFYLNGDPSLEIPLEADMWAYDVSPIIGKKMSDAEKQARLAKIAANKAAKAARGPEKTYWRLGDGYRTVIFNRPYEGIFGVGIKNNEGLQLGEQITFDTEKEALDFAKKAFPNEDLYAYKVKKTGGEHYEYIPVKTAYGKALASRPYYGKWEDSIMDKKGDRTAILRASIQRAIKTRAPHYWDYWDSLYDRDGKLNPKKLASEIKKYPGYYANKNFSENLLDQIEKSFEGRPLKDRIMELSQYYQYLNLDPEKIYTEIVNYLKNHKDTIAPNYRKVIDSL